MVGELIELSLLYLALVHRCVNGEIDDAKTVAAVLRAKVLLNL